MSLYSFTSICVHALNTEKW